MMKRYRVYLYSDGVRADKPVAHSDRLDLAMMFVNQYASDDKKVVVDGETGAEVYEYQSADGVRGFIDSFR